MKISDYKNEEAVELLADIFEPVTTILGDPELREAINKGIPRVKLISIALKNHKKEIVEILAITDGVPVEEYKCNPITILSKILSLMNDKELLSFFSWQSQMDSQRSSGSPMENTEESEE